MRTGSEAASDASVQPAEFAGKVLALTDLAATGAVHLPAANPGVMHDLWLDGDMTTYRWPQLLEADRYEGMQRTELMLNGILATKPSRLTLLLNSVKQKHTHTTEPEELSKAAAALLDAFQWNVEP